MSTNGVALTEKKAAAWYAELLLRALPLADTLEEAVAAVEVALSHNPEPDAEVSAMFGWVATNTTNRDGLPGWKNQETGEYRYQKTWPGTPRTTRPEEPATPRAPARQEPEGGVRRSPAVEPSTPGRQKASENGFPAGGAMEEANPPAQPEAPGPAATPQTPAAAPAPPTQSPAWIEARTGARRHLASGIGMSGLSPEKAGAYAETAATVFDRMSEGSLNRFQAGVQAMYFAPDSEDLNRVVARDDPAIGKKIQQGYRVGGSYAAGKTTGQGRLYLDGNAGKLSARDIYAHEFMHVVDGPRFEISSSEEWKAAWNDEIKGKELGEYAWKDEKEGLAEFGRLLWTHGNTEEVVAYFPKVAAVLRKYGVI